MNTEQENRLTDDLRRLVAGQAFRTDPDAVLRRARRAHRRGLVVRGAAGTAVLAVVVAGTVIGIDARGAGAPAVQNAAYVVEQVSAALNGGSDYVYRIVDHDEGTVWYQDQVTMSQYWVYGTGDTRTEAWDSTPVIDHYAHIKDVTINHKDRTYSTDEVKLPGYIQGDPPRGSSFVDRIKTSIRTGQVEIIERGEYQGHRVIKLGYTVEGQDSQLWVDSASYLPVYSVTTDPAGRKTTRDLAFLPRTPDLAKVVNTAAPVPPGFSKVADANSGGPGHGG